MEGSTAQRNYAFKKVPAQQKSKQGQVNLSSREGLGQSNRLERDHEVPWSRGACSVARRWLSQLANKSRGKQERREGRKENSDKLI